MEKYRASLLILILTAVPFLLPLVFWAGIRGAGWIHGNGAGKAFEQNWGVELSSEWEESCYVKSDMGFHGDGERYSVYEHVSEDSIAGLRLPFMQGKNEAIVEEFCFVADAVEVREGMRPDFTRDFIWAKLSQDDGSYVIFLFFPKECRLYLAQAFL